MDGYDNLKRAFTFVFAIIGILVFYLALMVHINAMAQQTEMNWNKLYDNLEWQESLNRRDMAAIKEKAQIKASHSVK